MCKQEFLDKLRARLAILPEQDLEERLGFYSEMIDDIKEEGKTEEEAVMDIGSVDEIAAQIISEVPFSKLAKERLKPKRKLKAWEIVILTLGSPIWLSLAVAIFAVVVSLYAVLWSVIISIWAVFVSLASCALGGIVAGAIFALGSNTLSGIAMIGASILCTGLAIFLFFGCRAATKGVILLTKSIASGIKKCFIKKEDE